jgi:polysaccharide deacetylase family protein (PEP-CTERM system associated)
MESKPATLPDSIFSVDVEDWFHILDIPSAPPLSEWRGLPSRVERNFRELLDLFSRYRVRTTCFFLGWIGETYPHLVKEAAARGHEVASHGYAHRLVYEMSRQEFTDDVRRSRELLEDLAGEPVAGYRAAGFSSTEHTPWFFDALAEAGYTYDSSVFPALHGHGGVRGARRDPHRVPSEPSPITEFPITVAEFLGRPFCFFGGGYLRLFPYALIRRMGRQVQREGRPVVFYIHPREIDPGHPRLPMSLPRRFKSYVNLNTTAPKLERIFSDFSLITFRDFLAQRRIEISHAHR